MILTDYALIAELAGHFRLDRRPMLQRLGDEAAAHIHQVLPEALARFGHVILLTHVPPLREACWHAGRLSDDNWVPHFTCKVKTRRSPEPQARSKSPPSNSSSRIGVRHAAPCPDRL